VLVWGWLRYLAKTKKSEKEWKKVGLTIERWHLISSEIPIQILNNTNTQKPQTQPPPQPSSFTVETDRTRTNGQTAIECRAIRQIRALKICLLRLEKRCRCRNDRTKVKKKWKKEREKKYTEMNKMFVYPKIRVRARGNKWSQ